MKRTKITLEQKQEAVRIALDGQNPLDYLRSIGSKDPAALWYNIRQSLKDVNPEAYAKIQKLYAFRKKPEQEEPKPADTPEESCQDEPERTETEKPAEYHTLQPLMLAGMTACGWKGIFGKYCWDDKHEFLDFFGNDGEEISMKLDDWKKFLLELKTAAELLGVSL